MPNKHLEYQARRIIAGKTADGKSTVVADEVAPIRTATTAFTVHDIWRVEKLPVDVDAFDDTTGMVELAAPAEGVVYKICTFPPDSEFDMAGAYQASLEEMKAADTWDAANENKVGMHATDSVDVITMISGEMYAVLEDTEILVRPGDSFVQRGGMHSWSNRTSEPATFVAIMLPIKS